MGESIARHVPRSKPDGSELNSPPEILRRSGPEKADGTGQSTRTFSSLPQRTRQQTFKDPGVLSWV